MSQKAAIMVASQITLKPNSVIGLATGDTPLGMYEKLIEMYNENKIDFSKITTFNLDEYCGLGPDNINSYHTYMEENFFKHINIEKENVHIPNGLASSYEVECQNYEKEIKKCKGIELQILGIGSNGHIGFNEPSNELNVSTSIVDLTEETIEANSRFFKNKEDVPRKAISMGMATILKADRIVLLASGENKAKVIKETINGKIKTSVPASLIQTHPNITIILDKDAASLINKNDLPNDCNFDVHN